MVAFFQYSPIDILSVHLPPSVLEFNGHVQQDWIRKEAEEVLNRILITIILVVTLNVGLFITCFGLSPFNNPLRYLLHSF